MPVQNKSQVPIGTVLEGKFRITREIGRGGMAAVYEAENIDIGKRVAVKVLAAELITSRVVRERFIREARAAAAVRSPNICDVYDSGMYEERPFLVMELLEGESLYDLLTRLRRLDIPTTLTVATQTARGLAKAHDANIVHRDLKPENIFVSQDEDGGLIVKLLDFGLAKFYEPMNEGGKATRLTREGALFGTPAYMSPEQAKGQGEVDHRADLWALGCIIYECLTGQTVWNVEQGVAMILAQVAGAPLPRPTKLRPDLPPTFDTWFAKALNRDADKRFQTARELADTLEDALVPTPAAVARAARSPSRPGSQIDVIDSHAVDALIDASNDVPTAREPVLSDVQPGGDALTSEPSRPKSRGPGALGQLMIAAVIALGGYAAWLYFLHPPPSRAKVADKQGKQVEPATSAPARTKPGKKAPPDDDDALVETMSEAQVLFAKEPDKALEKLKAALGTTQVPAVRSLYSHASVAVEEATKGGCKTVAVARPRPYELEQPVSRPVILGTSTGAVLAWVDNHADPRKRQAHAVVLDEALRRTSVPIPITPEATNVQDLELLKAKDKLALLYWDSGGREPGVFVRTLEADGRIASPAKRISATKSSDFDPSIVSAGDGFWVVWSEQLEYGSTDLVVRRLGPNLEPRGEAVRLTAFTLQKGLTRRASAPEVALSRSELQIAFSLQLPGQMQQVSVLTVPIADLESGLEMPRPGKRVPPPKKDTVLGTLRSIKRAPGRNAEPHIECNAEACFVTWDEEKAGAFVAYLQHGKTAPLWHREFASKGARPMITMRDRRVELAWYEDSRVRLAQVTRDQVGTPSVINRVNGLQPHPDLSPTAAPNGWYLTWRDYEAGHLEVFALRAECP